MFFILKSLVCDPSSHKAKKKPRVPNLSGFIESNFMCVYRYIYICIHTEYMHMT